MRLPPPRRRRHKQLPRTWLLLLLPALLLLTAPLPLPRSVREAGSAPPAAAGFPAVPTARIVLGPSPPAPPPASATLPAAVAAAPAAPLPTAALQLTALPPTEPPPPPSPPPSATPPPPSATLPPPLLIITPVPQPTVPPAPPALPTLMPTLPAAPPPPAAAPPAGPVAPPGQPLYIPTLMYHYVRVVDAGSDPLGYNLSVTPENLEAQLDWLVQAGYTTVTMNTLLRCRAGGTPEQPCPAKPVALTFDDGYEDAFTLALPALQRRGMVATFYIVGNFVGSGGYLTWDQVRALQAAGMEIGAHSMNHPDLTTLGYDGARAEIAESKAVIEANIGRPVTSFCYPAGRFNGDVVALVAEAGFTNATTTLPDLPQSDPLLLPRLRVEGSYGLGQFQGLVP